MLQSGLAVCQVSVGGARRALEGSSSGGLSAACLGAIDIAAHHRTLGAHVAGIYFSYREQPISFLPEAKS